MSIQKIRALQACEEKGIINPIIKTVHAEIPETYINSKKYTLVFPKCISGMYHLLKDVEISFEGLITLKRDRFLRKLYEIYESEHKPIIIYSSEKGRQKENKELDYRYFEILHRSKFVACPDGDFTWSYRFFEAILCKAIPIIESDSPLYEDYKFYKLGDKLDYREDWIIHNLEKIKREMMLH